jgi:hypothetical protein
VSMLEMLNNPPAGAPSSAMIVRKTTVRMVRRGPMRNSPLP